MSPEIRSIFSNLLKTNLIKGPTLEIGATSDTTLLNLPELVNSGPLLAINSDPQACTSTIKCLSGNDLSSFPDNHFSLILCNSVLEHDLFFWKTLNEISRVSAPGAHLIIGVPSYGKMGNWQQLLNKYQAWLKIFLPKNLNAASITLGLHSYPNDYYRFSDNAMKHLLNSDWENIQQINCMQPPRVITCCTRKYNQ